MHLSKRRISTARLLAVLWVLSPCAASVAAAQTDSNAPVAVFESPEVTLRLVAKEAEADGTIRAALLVDLAPGWKTYWRDPGEAGIPPVIDLSGSRHATPLSIGLPVPHRFGDEYGVSNGYSEPMAIALTFREEDDGAPAEIVASVMLGVCETICIPVAAKLVSSEPGGVDTALVDAAFAAAPATGREGNAITAAALSSDRKHLTVVGMTSASVGAPAPDLFVAGPKGWSFGKPTSVERSGGNIRFDVPVLAKPRKAVPGPLTIDAVTTDGATGIESKAVAVSQDAG